MPKGPFGFPRVTDIGPLSDLKAEQEFNVEEHDMPVEPTDDLTDFLTVNGIVPPTEWKAVKMELVAREKVPEKSDKNGLEKYKQDIERQLVVIDREKFIARGTFHYNHNIATIGMVEVKEDFRRQGLAKQLKHRMISYMKSRGVQQVYTKVVSNEGRMLAESTGFKEDTPYKELTNDPDILYRNIE